MTAQPTGPERGSLTPEEAEAHFWLHPAPELTPTEFTAQTEEAAKMFEADLPDPTDKLQSAEAVLKVFKRFGMVTEGRDHDFRVLFLRAEERVLNADEEERNKDVHRIFDLYNHPVIETIGLAAENAKKRGENTKNLKPIQLAAGRLVNTAIEYRPAAS